MCLFHKYVKVNKDNHHCGQCYVMPNLIGAGLRARYPDGFCPHSIEVCKCGKWKGWGSHGRLSVIPDNCKKQVEFMIGRE